MAKEKKIIEENSYVNNNSPAGVEGATTEKKKEKKRKKSNLERKNERERRIKKLKIALAIIAVILTIIYIILRILNNPRDFTIMLGTNFSRDKGIIMYESIIDKNEKKILAAPRLESMDNISIRWIPPDIDNEKDGSHNGDNYLAYTFYLEHLGIEVLNYWYSIYIDDVFRNVDEATRIMVFLNGERTVYAKRDRHGNPEPNTKPFYSADCVLLEERQNIRPGDIDKFTIVFWIEGDDPDCVDALIGGTMKMHMEITDEKDLMINREENTPIV